MLFVKHYSTHNYDDPYKVLKRTDNFFTLDINGTQYTVSVDCLKPVYFECLAPTPSSPPTTTPVVPLSFLPLLFVLLIQDDM